MLLHIVVPLAVALLFFRRYWLRATLVMIATMLVDLDHLLASPSFDPNRCSVGFHPLHTWPAIAGYLLLVFPRATRLVGLGLLIHMLLDAFDCVFMR
jgi:hypothetical protein